MARLLHKGTGNAVEVPDAQVAAYLATGQYEAGGGDAFVQLGGQGAPLPVPVADLGAIAQGDIVPSDASQQAALAQEAVLEDEYGGGLSNVGGLLIGGARGLSAGFSDAAAAELLDDETLFAYKQLTERNPVAGTVGEVGGLLGGAFLSGGSGLAAKLASVTPSGMLARMGGGLAAKVTGDTLTRAATRTAIVNAFEGAGYSVGSTIGHARLNDDSITIESVLASASLGGALGGGTGGLFGLMGGAASRRLLGAADNSADDLTSALNRFDANADELAVAQSRLEHLDNPGGARPADPARQAANTLDDLATKFDGAPPVRRGTDAADPYGYDKKVVAARKQLDKARQKAEAHPEDSWAEAAVHKARRGLQNAQDRARFARRNQGHGPLEKSPSKAFQRARAAAKKEFGDELDLSRIYGMKNPAKAIEAVDAYSKAVRGFDGDFAAAAGADDIFSQAAVSRRLGDSAADLAKISDGDLARALDMDPVKVAGLDPLPKTMAKQWAMLQEGAATQVNDKAGLIKRLVKSGFVGAGRNMIPAGVRGSGIVSSIVRGGFRQAGGAVGGAAFGALLGGTTESTIAGALAATPAVRGRIATGAKRAVAGLAKRSASRAVTAGSIFASKRFGNEQDKNPGVARMREIQSAMQNIGATREAIKAATLPISLQNPAVGEKVQLGLEARLQYIFETMPKRRKPLTFSMAKGEPLVSSYEMAKWARVVKAAEDPLSILDDFRDQQLAPESVKTVKTLYPQLFQQMQVAVMEEMSGHELRYPYQVRLQASVFFDVPIDPSMAPEFGNTIQGLYNQGAENPPQPRGSLGQPVDDQTQLQRLTSPT